MWRKDGARDIISNDKLDVRQTLLRFSIQLLERLANIHLLVLIPVLIRRCLRADNHTAQFSAREARRRPRPLRPVDVPVYQAEGDARAGVWFREEVWERGEEKGGQFAQGAALPGVDLEVGWEAARGIEVVWVVERVLLVEEAQEERRRSLPVDSCWGWWGRHGA